MQQANLRSQFDMMRVHVVDNDQAARLSVTVLLRSYGYLVEPHRSGHDFLAWMARSRSEADSTLRTCILLDLHLPDLDGLAVLEEMRVSGLRLPVIAVSGISNVGLAVRAIRGGAMDLLTKPISEEHLLAAIKVAMARAAGDEKPDRSPRGLALTKLATLTDREKAVQASIVQGHPNKVIAHQLGISRRTVEIHRSTMMKKLECKGIADIVRLALHAGVA